MGKKGGVLGGMNWGRELGPEPGMGATALKAFAALSSESWQTDQMFDLLPVAFGALAGSNRTGLWKFSQLY